MKAVTNRLFYKAAEFALTAGVILLGGALAKKTLFEMTGDEVLRVHRFEKGGQKGVVIDGDTAFYRQKSASMVPLK